MPGNMLGVVWVDARAQAANPEDLEASYAVRYAAFDSSWKRTAEGEIDKKTCECCGTSAAITSDGVIAVFRDRSDKEIRDIAVSRYENGKWTGERDRTRRLTSRHIRARSTGRWSAPAGQRRRCLVHGQERSGTGMGCILERRR
jgi:hypothetical protein